MRIPLYMAISVYRTRMVGSNCLVRFARSAWDEMTSRVDTLRPEIPPALGPSSCHFWTLLLAQGTSGCACPAVAVSRAGRQGDRTPIPFR